MALLAAIALSSFVFTADPKGDLGLLSVKVCVHAVSVVIPQFIKVIHLSYPASAAKKVHPKQELAFVSFNVTAGLFFRTVCFAVEI